MNPPGAHDADVIVVGGGPSGATAAALLAKRGHDVLVLERDTFPRFRIGESLLPCDLPVFERLGIQLDEAEYIKKLGAIFHDDRDRSETVFHFAEGMPGTDEYAWQVERSRFDALLLDNARSQGARVQHGIVATRADFEQERVSVQTDQGPISARYLIDATGPKALMGKQKRAIEPIRGFGIAAVFAHWTGLADEQWRHISRDGHITVLITAFGWGWVIPLKGKTLSVGFVSKEKGLKAGDYDDIVRNSPYVSPLVAGATMSEPRLVGNFSFLNREPAGSRYMCIGDAAGFLDPVFSSGVSLGMLGADLTVPILSEALTEGREAESQLMFPVRDQLIHAYESFGSLIHRFYNTRIVKNVFFHENPDPVTRSGLISVLAGDVWRDDNAFQNAILSGRQRWQYGAEH